MSPVLTYILEVLICSGIFTGLYRILASRTSFRTCRIYLICTILLSALIPALRLPLYPPEEQEYSIHMNLTITETQDFQSGSRYTLAENDEVGTPFSFWRTIYMGNDYEPCEKPRYSVMKRATSYTTIPSSVLQCQFSNRYSGSIRFSI